MLDNKKPIVTINLTPLVDVSLVLVVIFMAAAPMFMQSGIIVSSGEKKGGAVQAGETRARSIVIRLETDQIYLNRQAVTLEDLPEWLGPMLQISEDKRVLIQPGREVRHGRVIRVMDIAKQSGAAHLVILGPAQAGE